MWKTWCCSTASNIRHSIIESRSLNVRRCKCVLVYERQVLAISALKIWRKWIPKYWILSLRAIKYLCNSLFILFFNMDFWFLWVQMKEANILDPNHTTTFCWHLKTVSKIWHIINENYLTSLFRNSTALCTPATIISVTNNLLSVGN